MLHIIVPFLHSIRKKEKRHSIDKSEAWVFFFLSEYTISKLSVRLLENMLLKLIRLQISSRITWAWDETVDVKDFAYVLCT